MPALHPLARGWIAALALFTLGVAPAAEPPLVAAASDLQFALGEIAERFAAETAERVRLSFGSSGNLARQIRQGAPFQVYFSADEQYVGELAREGLTEDEGALYAQGRLVLLVPEGSPLVADATLEDLRAALSDGRLTRFAIANPEHAPYGQRAAEVLRQRGLWEAIEPRLVLGENASQAAQFATSGSTEGGIIAYSLARSPALSTLGAFALIPVEWHAPLYQRMVLLKGAGPIARQFYNYVRSPATRVILERYGFILPAAPP
jgi:molybdate transport system substrate-binding protein